MASSTEQSHSSEKHPETGLLSGKQTSQYILNRPSDVMCPTAHKYQARDPYVL